MMELDTRVFYRSCILRLLELPQYKKAFIQPKRFADQEVADYIGLSGVDPGRGYREGSALSQLQALIEEDRRAQQTSAVCLQVEENIRSFAACFEIDLVDVRILLFLSIRWCIKIISKVFELVPHRSLSDNLSIIAHAIGEPVEAIQHALSQDKMLLQSGLVKWDKYDAFPNEPIAVFYSLARSMLMSEFCIRTALKGFAHFPSPDEPPLKAFECLEPGLSDMAQYLQLSLQNKKRGTNLLIYGSDSDKNLSLARALVKSVQAELIETTMENPVTLEQLDADEKVLRIRSLMHLLHSRHAVVISDFGDCVVASMHNPWDSSSDLNVPILKTFFESHAVPVIWVLNHDVKIPEFALSRFNMILQVRMERKEQLKHALGTYLSQALGARQCQTLEEQVELPVAVVGRARENAEFLYPKGEKQVEAFTRFLDRLVAYGTMPVVNVTGKTQRILLPFDETFLNAEPSIEEFSSNIQNASTVRCLLHGPPGTGKTAFGKWMARLLKCPLHILGVSDLVSCYVGKTEQNLADAFRAAKRARAILMIDEVDSFLRDRSLAKRSWEITAVNEFLSRLDTYEGAIICTTNHLKQLDPACLRRFDYKIKIDYLNGQQSRELLTQYCQLLAIGRPLTHELEAVENLSKLTPGDFVNVVRQHPLKPITSPTAFLDRLEAECQYKSQSPTRKLGFG